MIEIDVRKTFQYKGVKLKFDNTVVELDLGLLDEEEAKELAEELLSGVDSLIGDYKKLHKLYSQKAKECK